MASNDLIFGRLPNPTGGPVEIVFGDDDGLPAGAVELLASGTITGLRGRITVRVATTLRAAGGITGLRGRIGVAYDVNVERPVTGVTVNAWQDARPLHVVTQSRYEQAQPVHATVQAVWQDARTLGAVHQVRWQQAQRLDALVRQVMQQARPLASPPTLQRFEDAARLRAVVAQRMQQARPLATAPTLQRFEDATRLRNIVHSAFEQARPVQAAVLARFTHAVPLSHVVASRYEEARKPPPGISSPPKPPVVDPCYLPTLPAHLVFDELADSSLPAHLVFLCERHGPDPAPGETIVVPVRRVYVVINEARLRRVDGDIQIPTFTMSMSLDTDSWAWGFSADVPRGVLPNLQPSNFGDPVELEAWVNGVPYRFLAEQLSTSRTFGKESLRISGRGLTATLDAPYAPTLNFGNTAARTAQQLMGDVLTVNGVPFGWTVDWQLTDWLVPGNVWTHQGAYVGALKSIVQAAGGYLQPHESDKVVKALLRYPTAPWEWGAAADFELPADVTTQEGIVWQENPRYNRVFVSGVSAGVLGQITRAGTDGASIAPMVTDALITHADAARQRGVRELAAGGRQAMVSLQLPVLETTGVIPPGKMVRYVDGSTTRVGITRSVQVDVRMPEIFQSIEVETYA